MVVSKWSLPCVCGDCGSFQLMYEPYNEGESYILTYRCRRCGREYNSITDVIEQHPKEVIE